MSGREDPIEALKRRARVEKAKADLGYFRANYVLGADSLPFVDGPHHKMMDQYYYNGDMMAFCAPVGFAKSQWMLSCILWEICKNKNIHIIYASHTYNVASDMMQAVMFNLESNQKLIEDFGPFRDSTCLWREEKFSIMGNSNPRVPTMTIVGAGGRIENVRVERLFTDDAVTLNSALSESERAKVENWFFNEFFNRLNRGGKVCLIGSRFHPDDLYAQLKKKPQIWTVHEFKAVTNWEKKEVLWPERWPFEELMRRRDIMGAPVFEARLQQDPAALYSAYFKDEYLRYIRRPDLPIMKNLYMGWDFNLSTKTSSDFTVGVVMGDDGKGNWYVLDVFRHQIRDGHVDAVIDLFKNWQDNAWNAPIAGIFLEDNLFQALIGNEVIKRAPQLPVVPLTRVKDKITRILRIQPIFQQKRVYFVDDLPQLESLIGEVTSFPREGDGYHDDFLDAMEAAMTYSIVAPPSNKVQVVGSLDTLFEKADGMPRREKKWWA